MVGRRPRRDAVAVDAADRSRTARCAGCSSATAAPTAATCARRSARCCTRWWPTRPRPRARCSPNSKTSGPELPFESAWHSDNELARHRSMLSTFAQWRAQTRHELTEVGTEVDVDGVVGQSDGALPGVRVRGRLDRLERDGAGRLVVVDIKTGKSPVSKDDAQRHAQLAMYQLAVAEGLLPHGGAARRRPPGLPRQDQRRWCDRTRAGRADPRRPRRMARAGAARGRRHPGAAVRRPRQRRLRALPGAGQLPRPGGR